VSAQDGRAVTICNALNIRLQILVSDDGNLGLESVTVGGTVESEAFEVFCLGVLGENLGKDSLLDGVSVFGNLLDELKSHDKRGKN